MEWLHAISKVHLFYVFFGMYLYCVVVAIIDWNKVYKLSANTTSVIQMYK